METTSDTATALVFVTADQAEVLNEARRVLKAISEQAWQASLKVPARASYSEASALDCGRLTMIAATTADALFDVLNVASSYCNSAEAKAAIDSWNAA